MPHFKMPHCNMYYELHGKGDPLILISGLKGDHTGWLPVLNELSKNYQVLIFDNRAVGRTTDNGEDFTVESMANDVATLISSLNLINPHVVGHSMGGAIAQVLAHKYKDIIRSVTLCNTFICLNETSKNVFKNIINLYEIGATQAEIMDSIVPWVFSTGFINPDIINIIRKSSNENPFPQNMNDYTRQLKALCDFDSSSWVGDISINTFILGASEDKVATIDESKMIASKIHGSIFEEIAGGHASQVEQPEIFVKVLQDFLKTCSNQSILNFKR